MSWLDVHQLENNKKSHPTLAPKKKKKTKEKQIPGSE